MATTTSQPPRPDMTSPNSILSQVALGVKYDLNDAFIAVMGVTGSGKSTFISHLVGGAAKVGHDLISCTSEIEIFTLQTANKTIHLIDTPGFDDTYRTDSDVLKDIVYWLNKTYQADITLSGIVYLHPINQNRMTGSAHKNLRMFNKLCGNESLHSVVLASTMWKLVDEEEGERRQEQLKAHPEFWGDMCARGSSVVRHEDSRASAMNIVTYIVDQRRKTVLAIQREMVDDGKRLDETSAGQELDRGLKKQREAFERRIAEAQEEMREAMEEGNKRAIEEAMAQQERFQKKLDEALKGSSELKVGMEKLLEQKDEEYNRALARLQAEKQRNVDDLKDMTRQVEKMKLKIREKDGKTDDQQRRHEYEMAALTARLSAQHSSDLNALKDALAQKNSNVTPYSPPPIYDGYLPAQASNPLSPYAPPPPPPPAYPAYDNYSGQGPGAVGGTGQALGVAAASSVAGALTTAAFQNQPDQAVYYVQEPIMQMAGSDGFSFDTGMAIAGTMLASSCVIM